MTSPALSYRRVPVERIIQLRYDVLIVGTTRTSATFDGDDEPTTVHLGGLVDDRCVACASLMAADLDDTPAYQLRGMAVAAECRGRGIGAALLAFAESQVDVPWLWCNARTHAAGFYAKHGWRQHGELFDIEGVGPHVRMMRELA